MAYNLNMNNNNNTTRLTTLWTIEYAIASAYVCRYGGIEAFLADSIDQEENTLYTTRQYCMANFEVDHRATSTIHNIIAQRTWKAWLDKCIAAQEQ